MNCNIIEKLKKDRFFITVEIKSFVDPKDTVNIKMLFDTGAQVSTLSRATLEKLGFYELIERFIKNKCNYVDIPYNISSSGIRSATGHISKTGKIQIKGLRIVKNSHDGISINSNNMYFDFNIETGKTCNDIFGMDLIKFFESNICTNSGITILKMKLMNYIEDNNDLLNNIDKSDNDYQNNAIDYIIKNEERYHNYNTQSLIFGKDNKSL